MNFFINIIYEEICKNLISSCFSSNKKITERTFTKFRLIYNTYNLLFKWMHALDSQIKEKTRKNRRIAKNKIVFIIYENNYLPFNKTRYIWKFKALIHVDLWPWIVAKKYFSNRPLHLACIWCSHLLYLSSFASCTVRN